MRTKQLLLLSLLLAGASFQQARAQAPADGGPVPTGPTTTPIDGGAALLLAGGAAYALRHLRRKPQQ